MESLSYDLKKHAEEIEDAAFQGKELPDGLGFADQLLFLKFRYLYAYARAVKFPKEQGKREKMEILSQYVIDLANDELIKHTAEMWKRIELATCEIQKDKEIRSIPKVKQLLVAINGGDICKE